jgi:hypothetical protein
VVWGLINNIFSINVASLTEDVSKVAAEEIFGAHEVQVGRRAGVNSCFFLTYLTGINVIANLINNELFLNVFICEIEQKFKLSVNWIGLKVVDCLPFPCAFHFVTCCINQCS